MSRQADTVKHKNKNKDVRTARFLGLDILAIKNAIILIAANAKIVISIL